MGDADLNGYPDLALGLKNNTDGPIYPAILRNVHTKKSKPEDFTFKAHLLPGIDLKEGEILRQIAFFDQEEDVSHDFEFLHFHRD